MTTKSEGMNFKLIGVILVIMAILVGVSYASMEFGLDAIQSANEAKALTRDVEHRLDVHETKQVEMFKAFYTKFDTLNKYHGDSRRAMEALDKGQRDQDTKLTRIQATLDAASSSP